MDQFIGEIRIFAGNFAPQGWAFCNGQLLAVASNAALFSIIGNVYGGDGKTNFALPNLQGRAAIGQGAGPGLTVRPIGSNGGESAVTLLATEIPPHTHGVACGAAANQAAASGNVCAGVGRGVPNPYATTLDAMMLGNVVQPSGNGLPHNNSQPYLGMSFIIALEGEFPPRS